MRNDGSRRPGGERMRILVAGATGQLAQSLIEACARRSGWELTAVGRPDLDLQAPPSLARAIAAVGPHVVVNAAAYTAVDRAESEPDLAFAINRDGAAALAKAAADHGLPIVHVSTDYVFDGRKTGAYVETDDTDPQGVYGRSKLAGEEQVAAANPRSIILRTAWVHSPFGSNFVKTMLRLAAERPELRVVADQRGNPTYAPHLAEAILAILPVLVEAPPRQGPWGVYHAAGQGDTTWHGLAQEVMAAAAVYGRPRVPVHAITTEVYPTPARRPANSRMSGAKLASVFGITLPHWSEGVRECVGRLCSAA
jgi:dTDP-4-dehydrorhamnose reductase